MPYNFAWSVKDEFSSNDYGHTAKSDGRVVSGSYRVLLPDGRTQIVSYTADSDNGYVAHVTYEGSVKLAQQPLPEASHHVGQASNTFVQQQHPAVPVVSQQFSTEKLPVPLIFRNLQSPISTQSSGVDNPQVHHLSHTTTPEEIPQTFAAVQANADDWSNVSAH